MRILQEKQKGVPAKVAKEIVPLREIQRTTKSSCLVGLVPVMLPLYDRIMPALRSDLDRILAGACTELISKGFNLLNSSIVSSSGQMTKAIENFENRLRSAKYIL